MTSQDQSIRKIGVMTSGGDAPGMNAAIRAVVRRALSRGLQVYGIRRGWLGAVEGGDAILEMTWESVGGIFTSPSVRVLIVRLIQLTDDSIVLN